MDHTFPELTKKIINRDIDLFAKEIKKPYNWARVIMDSYSKAYYGFADSLRTGYYSSYEHEKQEHGLLGFNCTTVIPSIYISCDRLGLKPEIVQFTGMKDIYSKNNASESGNGTVHFAIIVDIGKKHKYIIDPFWSKFGPIINQENRFIKIGKNKEYNGARREFTDLTYFSENEFAEMMDKMHEPAGSLEMLVAGQKIYKNREVGGSGCDLMVYYDHDSNIVSSRLFIKQVSISKKAVYCRMLMTKSGNVKSKKLELFLAKDYLWHGLKDERKVANVDFKIMYQIKRVIGGDAAVKRRDRIGPVINGKMDSDLVDLVDGIIKNTGEEALRILKKNILVRTLYETAKLDNKYLSTEEERLDRLKSLVEDDFKLRDEIQPLKDQIFMACWNLQKFDKNELRRMKSLNNKQRKRKSKFIEEIDDLNFLRKGQKHEFNRVMDQVLFVKQYEKSEIGDLEKVVNKQGLDQRIGYLAMVADFIPYITKIGRRYLTLDGFMGPLKDKIAVKYKKLEMVDMGIVKNIKLPETVNVDDTVVVDDLKLQGLSRKDYHELVDRVGIKGVHFFVDKIFEKKAKETGKIE